MIKLPPGEQVAAALIFALVGEAGRKLGEFLWEKYGPAPAPEKPTKDQG